MATAQASEQGARIRSAEEFREALDRLLTKVDGDDRVGPLIRATGLRLRFEFPDIGLTLDVAATNERGRHLHWSFSDDAEWRPRLTLEMDSETANAYLQGAASLPIAIARGRVRCKGEARTTLFYLPAARLMCEPYRRLVREDYPHLAVGQP